MADDENNPSGDGDTVEINLIEPVAPVVPYGAGTDGGQLDRIDAELVAVDAAMARLDSGAYGVCEVCGVTIDDALLAADPTLATCPAHVHLR